MRVSVIHMPQIEVSVPAAGIPNSLTYELPESLYSESLVGRRVRVTLRNRPVVGVIVGENSIERIAKPIEALLDETPIITTEQIALCRFVADYYMAPLGEVLRLCLPPDTPRTMKKLVLAKRRKKQEIPGQNPNNKIIEIQLNTEQAAALKQICAAKSKAFAYVIVEAEIVVFLLAGTVGEGLS